MSTFMIIQNINSGGYRSGYVAEDLCFVCVCVCICLSISYLLNGMIKMDLSQNYYLRELRESKYPLLLLYWALQPPTPQRTHKRDDDIDQEDSQMSEGRFEYCCHTCIFPLSQSLGQSK